MFAAVEQARVRGVRRGWLLAVVALCVIGGAAIAWQRTRLPPPPKFVTTPIDRGRLTARVTATGTLSALVTVQVGSQVSGRILAILADFNSPVTKNQVIARIDSQLFQAAVEQARANYVAADGNRNKTKVQA